MADIEDLIALNMRVGEIIRVEFFKEARVPAYKLEIDFGSEIGVKKTSAQLTKRYNEETLLGRQVVAVLGLPSKRIAGYKSECLVVGAVDEEGDVSLLEVGENTPIGWKIR